MAKTFLVALAPVVSCWITENLTYNHTLESAGSEISIKKFFFYRFNGFIFFKKKLGATEAEVSFGFA